MTIFYIAITVIISFVAFNRRDIFDRLKFNAFAIHKNNQWHRFLTYGFIHADWIHLAINMFVFYSFGRIVEELFVATFQIKGYVFYSLLYLGGIAFSTLYDYGKYKDNTYYNAVGASGAVSAIVFSSIILYPIGKIFLFFIPIGIPAPIFGILYLVYSAYMVKKGSDNIGHSAHFWGAIFGVIFTIAINPDYIFTFWEQVF
ncbi:MAG: rhomboid family intramembrane serine protease [Bacteroidales bacterium]|nr:rhomboid family intramembrane serine protease [Bacteroidales bacterium]